MLSAKDFQEWRETIAADWQTAMTAPISFFATLASISILIGLLLWLFLHFIYRHRLATGKASGEAKDGEIAARDRSMTDLRTTHAAEIDVHKATVAYLQAQIDALRTSNEGLKAELKAKGAAGNLDALALARANTAVQTTTTEVSAAAIEIGYNPMESPSTWPKTSEVNALSAARAGNLRIVIEGHGATLQTAGPRHYIVLGTSTSYDAVALMRAQQRAEKG
jgi:hypothetical protein